MKLTLLAVMCMALVATGCESSSESGGSEPTPEQSVAAAECQPAPPEVVEAVASGLTVQAGGSLESGVIVDIPPDLQNDQGFPPFFFAARILGEGMGTDTIGVWAVGDVSGGGPIIALNTMAREFSDWGSAAQEGSQAAMNRDTMASYKQAQVAEDCVQS